MVSKQEEIDWGLRTKLGELFGCDEDNYLYTASKELREWLASQGVVRRVDRELPIVKAKRELPKSAIDDMLKGKSPIQIYKEAQQDMLKAGYVAVEPLIELDKIS